jgi:arylsulfatase
VTGAGAPWRDFVHGEYSRHPVSPAMHFLTDETWKYIWFADDDAELLFDLGADPYETRDLAADPEHADVVRAWRKRLVDVLEPREAGLTRDGALRPQRGLPPVFSPYAADRRPASAT